MLSYVARRMIVVFLPTLLGISIVVFAAMHLIPGDFVDVMLGLGPDVSVEQREAIARAHGLDKPVPVQYLLWLSDAVRGDFGRSLRTGQPVSGVILDRLPATLELAVLATLASLLLAIPAGILSAVRRNGIVDALARVTALIGLSIPNFLLGTLLILFVSLQWPVLPTTGFVPVTEGIGANLKSSCSQRSRWERCLPPRSCA